MAKETKKKSFSRFRYADAFKQLSIKHLNRWDLNVQLIPPSDFLQTRLQRIEKVFDLRSCEESKKLVIDAFVEEGLLGFSSLKAWKGANLESDALCGEVDYLVAENKAYLEAPILCIIEAKKDDFEQGLAQCLVEMQACQWTNQQIGKLIDIFGIVTNADAWRFYTLTAQGQVWETLAYGIHDQAEILGALHEIFQLCDHNLKVR
jgi:hypothetical protein